LEAADPLDVATGARIRLRRRMQGMSQQALAERLDVSFQQVQKYERGANRVSASTLVRIAEALGCSAGWLLGEEPGPSGEPDCLRQLSEPGAAELLAAYAAIRDAAARNALLTLARRLAGTAD